MSDIKPKKSKPTLKSKIPRKPRSKNKNQQLTRNILIFIIIFLIAIIVSFGSYIYLNSKKDSSQDQQELVQELNDDEKILDDKINDIKQKLQTQKEENEIKEEIEVKKDEEIQKVVEIAPKEKKPSQEYKNIPKTVITEPKKPSINVEKPKLAIVIDDVVYASQVRALSNVGYPINMSFLPPTPEHPDSAVIARNLTNYMIHLPLEAMNFAKEEANTLHVGDSITKIENRIIELKALYPKGKYINNHTGSKFTSDEESMDKLMIVLKKHNLIFLDSKTTPKTVAYKYAKIHNVPFLSRDVFLDNVQEFAYIQKQLRQAINIAKQRGYAVAIGHPYSSTIDVLKSSVELLREVDVVYIDEIPLLISPQNK